MYEKEAELVNEEFITTENSYNLKLGGRGGFDGINDNTELRVAKNKLARLKTNNVLLEKYGVENAGQLPQSRAAASERMKKMHAEGKIKYGNSSGRKHSNSSKEKIGKANAISQSGSGNSQYGTRWIYSPTEKISKKIQKDQPLPNGWFEGRKIKF